MIYVTIGVTIASFNEDAWSTHGKWWPSNGED